MDWEWKRIGMDWEWNRIGMDWNGNRSIIFSLSVFPGAVMKMVSFYCT